MGGHTPNAKKPSKPLEALTPSGGGGIPRVTVGSDGRHSAKLQK